MQAPHTGTFNQGHRPTVFGQAMNRTGKHPQTSGTTRPMWAPNRYAPMGRGPSHYTPSYYRAQRASN